MTLRLDGLVLRGEIDNTRPYNVCGWLKIRGHRAPLTLNLTGDCGPSLKGRRIRFEDSVPADDRDEPDYGSDAGDLAWQQIGPTGVMTVEPADAEHSCRLRLEWFSQNGRVTLDLANPVLETLPDDDEDDEPDDDELAAIAAEADADDPDADEDDPFGLFSPELMRQFDEEADRLDRDVLPSGGEAIGDPSGVLSEAEMIEDLIENGEGVPIGNVFDPPISLPRPDALTEAECELSLKRLLAKLAEHGISLDVCEHFTPRSAYELLLDEICPFEMTHPELEAKHWVQHFSTSDFCEECEAEFEREFEEYERNRGRDGSDDDDD